jgi:alpha-beta hydrolase superfamily lysophospholipase
VGFDSKADREQPPGVVAREGSHGSAWIGAEGVPVLTFLTPAVTDSGRAAIICAPLLHEGLYASRPLRGLATRLAARGIHALRFDWPGTGTSGGDARAPGMLEACRSSVGQAVEHVRAATGAPSVGVVGIGIGGLIALSAVDHGLDVDALALWGVPASGKAWLREVRAYHRLLPQAPRIPDSGPPSPLAPGEVEIGGFMLGRETVDDLGALVPESQRAWPAGRRRPVVLAAGRDGMPPERTLVATLAGRRIEELTLATLDGFGPIVGSPETALVPEAAWETIGSWLDAALEARPTAGRNGRGHRMARVTAPRRDIDETVHWIGPPGERIFMIEGEPEGGPDSDICPVFLNAGAVRHCGPNAMWTRFARQLGGLGYASARIDVRNVGEADGPDAPYATHDAFYADAVLTDVDRVLAALGAARPRRFLLVGLCSGAFAALHTADRRADVAGIVMVNPLALVWNEEARALLRQDQIRNAMRGANWRRLLHRDLTLSGASRRLAAHGAAAVRGTVAATRARGGRQGLRQPQAVVTRMLDEGRCVTLITCAGDLAERVVARYLDVGAAVRSATRFRYVRLDGPDHTLRPAWSQEVLGGLIHATLDDLTQ